MKIIELIPPQHSTYSHEEILRAEAYLEGVQATMESAKGFPAETWQRLRFVSLMRLLEILGFAIKEESV